MSNINTEPVASPEPIFTEPDNGIPAETPIHPSWEQALAVVPDSLREGIYKQIRTSEAESQRAIETARQNSIDPSWRAFAEEAKAASIDPEQLVNAYNVSQQLAADPFGFQERLNAEIEQAVRSGQLTRAEGAAAIREVQSSVDDSLENLETPESKQIRELQARLDQTEGRMSAREQAEAEQEQAVLADEYMRDFEQTVDDTFTNAGYPNVAINTKIAVMRMADSALDGDSTGTLSVAAAVKSSFDALIAFRNQQAAAPAAAPAVQRLPIGGGNGAPSTQAPQRFDNTLQGKQAREDAMIAAGIAALAE